MTGLLSKLHVYVCVDVFEIGIAMILFVLLLVLLDVTVDFAFLHAFLGAIIFLAFLTMFVICLGIGCCSIIGNYRRRNKRRGFISKCRFQTRF